MIRTAAKQAQQLCERLTCSALIQGNQQTRNTTVVRRMYPPRLYKHWQTGCFRPALKRREYVYITEQDHEENEMEDLMTVVITKDIEGFAGTGEVIDVSKFIARTKLLPADVAVYPTDENKAKYAELAKQRVEKKQSITGEQTARKLMGAVVPIPMSADNAWTINKTHIRVACRHVGIHLREDSIILLQDNITSPGTIDFQVKVNNLDRVDVKGYIYHHNKDPDVKPVLPDLWQDNILDLDAAVEKALTGR